MVKVMKIGNPQGIVFVAAFMDLSGLKVGGRVDVTVVPDTGALFRCAVVDQGQMRSARSSNDNRRV
jgi:hypothetical protein